MARAGTKKVLWALLAALLVCSAPAAAHARTAVVVVGPVDPPANELTRAYIDEADSVARIIEQAGYQVERLYHPRATWDRLRRAARGADLLVYYGHGNGQGWLGRTDPAWINGLCLTDPRSPDVTVAGMGVPGGNAEDLASLGLAPDCTVALVHTCYAAGSSQEDQRPVDYQTACARVIGYAQAFFRAGAGCYLATSFEGVAPDYFRRWASGQAPADAFMEVMAGTQIHSGAGLLLAEDHSGPRDPYPWVSAWVTRPGQSQFGGWQPREGWVPAGQSQRRSAIGQAAGLGRRQHSAGLRKVARRHGGTLTHAHRASLRHPHAKHRVHRAARFSRHPSTHRGSARTHQARHSRGVARSHRAIP
jgi:hypothetical protein